MNMIFCDTQYIYVTFKFISDVIQKSRNLVKIRCYTSKQLTSIFCDQA